MKLLAIRLQELRDRYARELTDVAVRTSPNVGANPHESMDRIVQRLIAEVRREIDSEPGGPLCATRLAKVTAKRDKRQAYLEDAGLRPKRDRGII